MKGVIEIRLDRPHRGNSIDAQAARELAVAFRAAGKSRQARLVILTGAGKNFCTGADLAWMAGARKLGRAANRKDALALAAMYQAILECEIPVLCKVQGKALGGGVGLASACDIVACTNEAVFRLPETGLGLVPGVLSPALIRRVGYARFLEYSLTGREISSQEALEAGLVAFRGSDRAVDRYLAGCAKRILENAPDSIRKTKASARALCRIPADTLRRLAELTAEKRVSAEAIDRYE